MQLSIMELNQFILEKCSLNNLIWPGLHGTSMILSTERMKREVLEERAGLKKGVTCAQRWHMGSEQDSVLSSQDAGVALQTLGPEDG